MQVDDRAKRGALARSGPDTQVVGNMRRSIVTVELLVTVVILLLLTVMVVMGRIMRSAVLFDIRFAKRHTTRGYVPICISRVSV